MSLKNKYLGTPIIYLLLFIFAAIAYMLAGYLVQGAFGLLCEEMPSVFKSASFVSDPEGYERQTKILIALTTVLALFLINYISLLLDNKRMEHIAKATEGKYTIKEGLAFYYRNFALSDILTSVIAPALLSVPVYFIPENWLDYGLRFPIYMELELCGAFGFFRGVIILIAVSIISRAASVPIVLSRWRAAWLSGTAEVI